MKNSRSLAGFAIIVCTLLAAVGASAIEFTTNTMIGALDFTFDGADIIVSNCTVTIDGAHAFNSLLLTNGAVLTHSYNPNGTAAIVFNVVDESQTLNSTNPATLLNTNVSPGIVITDTGHTITYTNDVDYVQTNLADGTTQIYRTDTSSIPDGATVLVSYTWSYSYGSGLILTVSNDVTVAASASINADGVGYGPSLGVGHGYPSVSAYPAGSGGGHGGYGGIGFDPLTQVPAVGGSCYGSLDQPTTLGSGGGASYAGAGGAGGGKIQISAGGTVSVDGSLSANGADATNSRAGGGAGGSIWITASEITGSGNIIADGGKGEPIYGGGGGGGRIAIVCGTNNYTGSMTAYGGSGWQFGGAGTLFTQTGNQTGLVLMDNAEHAGGVSVITLTNLSDLMITGRASVIPSGGFQCNNLTITTNSFLSGMYQVGLNLSIAGNMIIQLGGRLDMDSLGFAPGTGTSPGTFYNGSLYPGSGGGHGGNGGLGLITNSTPAGTGYGSQSAPLTLGSGGGGYNTSTGGAGGGAVQLNVAGTLQVDGTLSANGGDGLGTGGGGGAGGSVYLICNELTGSGSITANGGDGVDGYGGGGGGGRISAIVTTNTFSGTLSAFGGGGINRGGAGTIYLHSDSQTQLILDNGGIIGASTLLQSAGSALMVQHGAVGTANSPVTFASLVVGSNAWLTAPTPNNNRTFTIFGDAILQAGGGFMADSGGYGSGAGSGAGSFSAFSPYACGGGGHGGAGGNAYNNASIGGNYTADTIYNPSTTYPAGGGGGYQNYSTGGNAGGYVRLTVNGTLELDGLISAKGGNGSGLGGGGGAGGGISLIADTFAIG